MMPAERLKIAFVALREGSNVFHIRSENGRGVYCRPRGKTFPAGEAGRACPKCRAEFRRVVAILNMNGPEKEVQP